MQVCTIRHSRVRGWSGSLPEWDSPRTLVLVFGASSYLDDHEALAEITQAYGHSVVIGCSTAGQIHGSTIEDDTLSIALVQFAATDMRLATASIDAGSSRTVGVDLGAALVGEGLAGAFVLSTGLHVNGSELVGGFNDSLAGTVPITGGLAGDGDRFERTWVLIEGKPVEDGVAAVGFYGERVRLGNGSRGGWDPFGPERVVTRAAGNVVYEFDGRPALALYRHYLGDLAVGLPATGLLFPIEVRSPHGDSKVVRSIIGIDEDSQALTFAGDIPEGHQARLMRADFDRIVAAAADAAHFATAGMEISGDVLSIVVSCFGRRLVLGSRCEEELDALEAALPGAIHQVGMYSYGEISPYTSGLSALHNQTLTLTALLETGCG